VVAWPAPNPDTHVRVRIGARDVQAACNVGIPATDLDAQWTKLTHKFHALVEPLLGAAATTRLAALCRDLDAQRDLGELWRLARGEA
jgi:hypothetical protein